MVSTAKDGAEALRRAVENNYDLVITDIRINIVTTTRRGETCFDPRAELAGCHG